MDHAAGTNHNIPLLSLAWDKASYGFDLTISVWLSTVLIAVCVLVILWRWWMGGWGFKKFEIDQAEIGVGKSKFTFRPNLGDRQVGYAIWVELSTRKIGLPIDLEHDVIVEVYDSWYSFFSVTRELVKSIPVAQVRRASTQAIIRLSIEVLNEGLRPHLTQWQARFRRWYERELKRYDESKDEKVMDPQFIQKAFPQYDDLKNDLLRVNDALIRYRQKMRELVMND